MWPFKRVKKSKLPVLAFKTGQDFFDYHCKYMDTKIEADKPLVAIVLDATLEFGTKAVVAMDERGIQTAALKVASDDGGFTTFAQTLSEKGETLSVGDVVAWVPGAYNSELAKSMGSEQSGWVGLILAKVAPEIDIERGQMKLICQY